MVGVCTTTTSIVINSVGTRSHDHPKHPHLSHLHPHSHFYYFLFFFSIFLYVFVFLNSLNRRVRWTDFFFGFVFFLGNSSRNHRFSTSHTISHTQQQHNTTTPPQSTATSTTTPTSNFHLSLSPSLFHPHQRRDTSPTHTHTTPNKASSSTEASILIGGRSHGFTHTQRYSQTQNPTSLRERERK